MNEISNPHDKFIKNLFSKKESAIDFFRNNLPAEVVDIIDFDSMEYVEESFVDKHLKEYISDLLCRFDLKDGSFGYIYILFEHKSYKDPLAAFQVLKYMVRIWEKSLETESQSKFPFIIPLLFYHGRSKWNVALNFKDLFKETNIIEPFIPDFRYLLWDASQYTEAEIKGEVTLQVGLLLLKYIFEDDLKDRLLDIFSLLKELSHKRTGLEYIETVIKYITNAVPTENITYKDLKSVVDKTLTPEIGEKLMPTIADTLREEGLKEGMQQGMQQGIQQGMEKGSLQASREAVIDNLEIRFDVVPQKILKILNEIDDISILRILRRKSIKVSSMDEFKRIIDSMLLK